MGRVLLIAPYAPSVARFRGDLIAALVERGHEVEVAAPEEGFDGALASLGARYRRVPFERTGRNPIAEARAFFALFRLSRRLCPEAVLAYGIKPVIYGSLAARMARVPAVYAMVTGLGSFFVEGDSSRLFAALIQVLYKAALRRNKAVFFLNPDDRRFFEERRMLPAGAEAVVLPGSGINLERFPFAPPPAGPPVFLLMARLIRHKGIEEYAAAAGALKKRYPEASFRLLGPLDTNPSALREDEVRALCAQGALEYLGTAEDVYPLLAASSVYVLPSYYREGVPRSVLEAMAVGRPIVTTDVPGCRETVEDGVNGFLVPPRDARALAAAMEKFIAQPSLVPEMGRRSREIAERKFDVRQVNARILEVMRLG